MLGSPERLVFSRFVVDIAGGMRSGPVDATTNLYSQTKRGGDNPFDSRFRCGIDEYLLSHRGFLFILGGAEQAHLRNLVDFKVFSGSDD